MLVLKEANKKATNLEAPQTRTFGDVVFRKPFSGWFRGKPKQRDVFAHVWRLAGNGLPHPVPQERGGYPPKHTGNVDPVLGE